VDSTEPEEWSSVDCLRILRRNRTTLACITLGALALAALLCIIQPRNFQSTASLEIQSINENFLNFRDIYQTASPSADSTGVYIQTQVEILQQDALIDLVAKRLRLAQSQEFIEGRTAWERLLSHTGSHFTEQNIVEELKRHLLVTPVRNSRIIDIAANSQDRQLAADIANTLAETFISERTEERRREAQRTYDSLRVPVQELRHQIAQSEVRFEAYRPLPGVYPTRTADAPRSIRNPFKTEVDTNLRFYQEMLQKLNDAAVASLVPQANIRLVNKARPADSPYRPNVLLNLAVGIFGGLLLGAGWVMLREQTHSFLRTSGEAAKYLTVPELGAIPKFTDQKFGTTTAFHLWPQGLPEAEAGLERRRLSLSESFRTTLASILSSNTSTASPRILLVTSSLPSEGKTTVASNLAVALTEIAGRVLLIDGDMRRPRLHQVFQQANSWGLSNILLEKNAIEDLPVDALVKKTGIPRLSLLSSGPCTDSIFGLLHSGRISRLLRRFREEFDYVLIDAPPCLEFADARVTARYADKLLLVVRANWTTRQTAQSAIRRLLMDGIPLMGVILNHCDPDPHGLYGYVK